jgi:hypothetical protein
MPKVNRARTSRQEWFKTRPQLGSGTGAVGLDWGLSLFLSPAPKRHFLLKSSPNAYILMLRDDIALETGLGTRFDPFTDGFRLLLAVLSPI